jgi:hypothetical protein
MKPQKLKIYLENIGLLDRNIKGYYSNLKMKNFYYFRVGAVRILFCKRHHRITPNSFNLYRPGRSWMRVLYNALQFLSEYAPTWLLDAFLQKIQIPEHKINIRLLPGLQAIFLGANSTNRKFTCVYEHFVEKQAYSAEGHNTLKNEIEAMQTLSNTALSELLIPHKIINTTGGYSILRTKFVPVVEATEKKLMDLLVKYYRTVLIAEEKGGKSKRYVSHGDFAPWNIRVGAQKAYVVDWENYSYGAPLLHDLFYFYFIQAALNLNRYSKKNALSSSKQVYNILRSEFGDRLPEFNCAFDEWIEFVTTSKRCNITLRNFMFHFDVK